MDARRPPPITRRDNDPVRATRLIVWADYFLKSEDRVERYLRPELEAGNVSLRDFEHAKGFLTSNHRSYPFFGGFLAALGVSTYGRYRAKWSFGRMAGAAIGAGFFGSVLGRSLHAKALFDFSRSLEDPEGFTRALENAYKVQTEHTRIMSTRANVDTGEDCDLNPQDGPSSDFERRRLENPSLPNDQNRTAAGSGGDTGRPTMTSRWEQIRAANARNAAQGSTWEAIRQTSGKAAITARSAPSDPGNGPTSANVGSGDDGVNIDQPISQADFEAMLEAERIIAKAENDDPTPTWK
ncbi:hypothetical protein PUNSTDRAFT_49026 [Punctularia strigosozonata HHB-11173 SS5]|uniref:uncharacterized protein n=1 Tax=Punctularia strigosozonata (strain HHB-11173) TaxID=741275 RepID=UPI0004416D79|nr:uncharacterized protein PUNSTDRAFT_49026 [Punctularia strigosozonata HHB-11173 SS5]EIN14199.1 hypothetical protein PUNSTDRAFT_49026 [Punctularia strigosozonata HHB-11173 SS5]